MGAVATCRVQQPYGEQLPKGSEGGDLEVRCIAQYTTKSTKCVGD